MEGTWKVLVTSQSHICSEQTVLDSASAAGSSSAAAAAARQALEMAAAGRRRRVYLCWLCSFGSLGPTL